MCSTRLALVLAARKSLPTDSTISLSLSLSSGRRVMRARGTLLSRSARRWRAPDAMRCTPRLLRRDATRRPSPLTIPYKYTYNVLWLRSACTADGQSGRKSADQGDAMCGIINTVCNVHGMLASYLAYAIPQATQHHRAGGAAKRAEKG